jgi:hypothetical protein
MLLTALLKAYARWKLKLVEQALTQHTQTLPSVEALADQTLLDLYDQVLGALAGPRTLRIRSAPSLTAALRLRASQRAFARSVYHHRRLAELNQ